jgi:hypothetical protein
MHRFCLTLRHWQQERGRCSWAPPRPQLLSGWKHASTPGVTGLRSLHAGDAEKRGRLQAFANFREVSNAWRSPYRVRAPSVRAFGRLREDPLDTTKPVLKAVKNGAPRPRRAAAMAARRALALMLLIASGSLTLGAQDDGSELQPPCASLPALRADDASRLPVHSIAAAVAAAAGGRTSW